MSSFNTAEESETRAKGPTGLAILIFMGAGMLAGILFLSWLGTPRIEPTEGKSLEKLDLKPIAYAEEPLSAPDRLKGKITVMHFWGTWCPPCRHEFPLFTSLAKEFAENQQVQIISVSSSKGAEYDLERLTVDTKQFMDQYSANMPTYADPAGLTRAQAGQLLPQGALPYPCTFVFNQQGEVARVWLGFSPQGMSEVRTKINQLLQ